VGHTNACILYVDDHDDTRLMPMLLLEQAGYGVMTAGTLAEGLEKAKEIPFDLFIFDTRLPDGTGMELCQKLHEIQPDTPVLYYTAAAFEHEKKRHSLPAGMNT